MERIYSTGTIVAANRDDLLLKISENVGTIGWELLDERISTNGDIFIKSVGHDERYLPVYVRIYRHDAYDKGIKLSHGNYYNSDDGSFINQLTGGNDYSWDDTSKNTGFIICDVDTYNIFTISGNKDVMYLDLYRPSNNSNNSLMVFRIDNTLWDNKIATLQEEINPGNNVVAQLNSGESSYFKTNANYRLISPLGHVSKPKIFAKDTVNDTVTFDNIVYTMASGTKFGPLPFPWASVGVYNYVGDGIQFLNWNIVNRYTTGGSNNSISQSSVFGSVVPDDVYNSGETTLTPILFYESNGTIGYSSYLYHSSYGSYNDVVGINKKYSGAVSLSTVSGISDNNKEWEDYELNGMGVIITSGEQEDTTRRIISNTYNTLTFDPPLPMPVSGSETYTVCETFYRKTAFNALGSNVFLKDI
jgi:hypothetical protein